MAIALKGRRHAQQRRAAMATQIARRAATLIAVGLFLDCPATVATWRLPGVLQYFAVSYAWVSLAVVLTGSWDGAPGAAAEAAALASDDPWRDFRFFWREWPVVAMAPLLWLALTFRVEVPGCGRGYLGPGGFSEAGKEACTGGSHRFIDLAVFGRAHMYAEPTCVEAYACEVPFDPEGLVGALNAVLLTYLGLMAGSVMVYHAAPKARLPRLATMGAACLLLGGALCGFRQHGGVLPVNKNLWSTSFVLVCGGGGCWVLALLYLLVDVWAVWDGAPFRYTGMNSIVVYAGSEILEGYWPFHVASSALSHWGHLAANVLGAAAWNGVATLLYRRGAFIKI
jgi:heparan-alpha-glucosaminide N-acetyltransferase